MIALPVVFWPFSKAWWRQGAVALLTALCCWAVSVAHATDRPLKVGFVYLGPVGDYGWTHQHNEGRLAVQKAFGESVKTAFVDEVPEDDSAERVIAQFAQQGYDLVFTTSYGFMRPTMSVASRFPNVHFEHASGYMRATNLATYNARFYEGRAVMGLIGGMMSKTNTIGYIASFPIPEVIQGIDAFTLAARKVNPKVQVKVTWVKAWYDPAKERDAALSLVAQGADILVQHTDSPAPVQVAAEKGIYAFGQSTDMSRFSPKAHLTAVVNNWGDYYVSRVKAVQNGTWSSTDTWDGLGKGMVQLAPYGPSVPAVVREKADALKNAIASGKSHPFTGPIRDQSGVERVKAGETLNDAQLSTLDWLVEGVQGSLPR